MAGDCGLNALSLLPENMLPQWQQKIALRAENKMSPSKKTLGAAGFSARSAIFCRYWTCSFSGLRDGLLKPMSPIHFHLLVSMFYLGG
jgi:hypothetical protein